MDKCSSTLWVKHTTLGHLVTYLFQSTKISEAAYENKWYDGSLRYKKKILFIMGRAQRPAEISAKGIIIISLDTFKIVSLPL